MQEKWKDLIFVFVKKRHVFYDREQSCKDFYRNQLQRQLQIVFNGVINTLESSGFNNNRCIHQQSCGACILKQRAQAIHAETGFTRQERGPLLLREVGLQP